jgi:hypothetical protein
MDISKEDSMISPRYYILPIVATVVVWVWILALVTLGFA